MHIGDMLARTGKDLGHATVYLSAESLTFCSADLSYRMMAADPRNIAACPYVLVVYVTAAEPEKVYVAYRKPRLLGDAATVESDIAQLLDTIAREAVAE